MTIEGKTCLRKATDQVSCELNGEVAILNLRSTLYFGLNRVGATVWDALEEPKTASQLCQSVMDKFEVDETRCFADVIELLGKLEEAGLIEAVPVTP